MYEGKAIGVAVPAYNEENLLNKTMDSMPKLVDRIYVVDDCSTDNTPQIINSLTDPRIYPIRHEQNRGVGAAIVSGYKRALEENIDIVVIMAGDNQMDPAHITKLIKPVADGTADYAKGDRLSQEGNQIGMSPWRQFGNWLLTWLTRIAAGNWKLQDPQNGYTAISNKALRMVDLDTLYPRYGYCNELLVRLSACGIKILDIPMPARYGMEKSKIRYSKYIPKVSWLLLKNFLWRLRVKYLKGGKPC